MKFRDNGGLRDAMAAASRSALSQPGLPGAGVLWQLEAPNRLRLTATNRERVVRIDVPVECLDAGSCLVPSMTAQVLRSLPGGPVEASADEGTLTLAVGGTTVRLSLLAEDESPLAWPATTAGVHVASLVEALGRVLPAAANVKDRPALAAVHVAPIEGALRVEATDTYRLMRVDIPTGGLEWQGEALIPAASVGELVRLSSLCPDQVSVSVDTAHAAFYFGDTALLTTLVKSPYPRTDGLFSSGPFNRFTVAKDDLRDALAPASLFVDGSSPAVQITFGPQTVLRASLPDCGDIEELLPGRYEGEQGLSVWLRPPYLLHAAGAVSGDELVLDVVAPLRPVVVHGTDEDGFTGLIAPVAR